MTCKHLLGSICPSAAAGDAGRVVDSASPCSDSSDASAVRKERYRREGRHPPSGRPNAWAAKRAAGRGRRAI